MVRYVIACLNEMLRCAQPARTVRTARRDLQRSAAGRSCSGSRATSRSKARRARPPPRTCRAWIVRERLPRLLRCAVPPGNRATAGWQRHHQQGSTLRICSCGAGRFLCGSATEGRSRPTRCGLGLEQDLVRVKRGFQDRGGGGGFGVQGARLRARLGARQRRPTVGLP